MRGIAIRYEDVSIAKKGKLKMKKTD